MQSRLTELEVEIGRVNVSIHRLRMVHGDTVADTSHFIDDRLKLQKEKDQLEDDYRAMNRKLPRGI
jgi:hypothetical protein